jgi:hypothetical protein
VGVKVGRRARCTTGVGVGISTSKLIKAQPGVKISTANATNMISFGDRNGFDLLEIRLSSALGHKQRGPP